jgi:AbrB family looped-hinge helix DNA binding protein
MDNQNEEWKPRPYKVRIAAGGRIVIPAEVRKELGVDEGDELMLVQSEHGFRISTVEQVLRAAQAYFRSLAGSEVVMSDELIRDRRAEAKRELDE